MLAGTPGYRGPVKTLPPRPLAHRLEVQLELAGNLVQPQSLFGEEVPDLAIGLVVDHD